MPLCSRQRETGRLCTIFLVFATCFLNLNYFGRREITQQQKLFLKKNTQKEQIVVFYNVFTKNTTEMILNSKDIVREQMRSMLPEYKVYVRSIGVKFQIENTTRLVHDSHGDEQETLIFLHDHCRINENDTVIYLHNKGSFHPSRQNHKLRKFLTESALSKECVNMPDYCNVCASRMSPFPHPHTSGNMWTAKCSYVRMLMNPKKFRDKLDMIYNPFTRNKDHDSCNGLGRFSVEHWIYSHPKVSPCDVSNSSFAWSYRGVPSAPFQFDLKQAPRFKLPFYEKKVCPSQTIETRLKEYNAMYGEMPGKFWWGWTFYNISYTEQSRMTYFKG
jgi:hypothetical protein